MSLAELAAEARRVWNFPAVDADGEPYLSPSSIKEYRNCPRCWYENRVLRQPKPASIHFAIGGAVHRAVEVVIEKYLNGTQALPDEAEQMASDEFDDKAVAVTDEDGLEVAGLDLGPYPDLGVAKDDALRFARLAVEVLPPLYVLRGIIRTELDMSELPAEILRAAFPFRVKGRMDAVYGTGDDANGVTDTKTSSKRGAPDMNDRLQVAMYGLPAHMAGVEWRVGFDVLVKNKVTPYIETYWANGDGYLTHEQYMAARDIVLDVAEHINRGDFPIGQGWAGTRHDYQHHLPEFSLAVSGFAE